MPRNIAIAERDSSVLSCPARILLLVVQSGKNFAAGGGASKLDVSREDRKEGREQMNK